MLDRLGSVIYVGKARDLRKRLASHFMPSRKQQADLKTRALLDAIWDFETHLVRNEQEALLLEGKLIKQYRPRYNVSFRDDKRFLLAKINPSDPWPRFILTRLRKDDGARYFGPFAHSGALRGTIAWLNREFGLRSCRAREPGETDYKHCSADVIRNCTAPCVGKITREAYLEQVDQASALLEGKGRRERLKSLHEEMEKASQRMDFERAARLRDIVQNLERTLNPTRQFSRGRGLPTTVKPVDDLIELGDLLQLPGPPTIMECFDISNVSSNHIVASMVRFVEGVPDNQNYRRYRIRTVGGTGRLCQHGGSHSPSLQAHPQGSRDSQSGSRGQSGGCDRDDAPARAAGPGTYYPARPRHCGWRERSAQLSNQRVATPWTAGIANYWTGQETGGDFSPGGE